VAVGYTLLFGFVLIHLYLLFVQMVYKSFYLIVLMRYLLLLLLSLVYLYGSRLFYLSVFIIY